MARGDTHFDFAAHDFLVFLDGPLKVFFQGAEFGDFAGEAGGLAAEFAGDDIQWEARKGTDAGGLVSEVIPEGGQFTAQWGNDAKSGNNDAVVDRHWVSLSKNAGKKA